ncbi:AHA1 [Sanghuangporus vaninii]
MSSMPPSTANWHWKNKNVTSWGKSWFERELPTIEIKEGEQVVSISEVTDVDGDIELGQRKSKLITIYDCSVDLKWKGTASDGTEVSGRLKIPEVSHEITLDRTSHYVYYWSLSTSSSPAVDELFEFAKARLPTALEAKFAEFPVALTATHGKDLQVTGSQEPSRTGTPAPATKSAASTSSANGPKVVKQEKKPLNTAKVEVESSFMASAEDLFQLLTEENKIPLWSRAPAQSIPEPGAPFSLFGGGVKGEFVSVEKPKRFVQKWALSSPNWPSEHFASLVATFDESGDSTKLILTLDGVPIGTEDDIKRNIEGYYIQGLKSIGYVQLVFPDSPAPSCSTPHHRPASKRSGEVKPENDSSRILAIVLTALVLAGAFALPFFRK